MTDETTHYRNEPANTFEAHVFDAEDVHDAGAEHGEKSERPVASICSRTTAYGRFFEVADVAELDRDNGTCDVCLDMLEREADE